MKKIILFSCLFSLISNSAFATYYKTSTNNCGTANMLAELDRATALHRAVVTEIDCEYTVPTRPAPSFVAKPKPMPRPMPKPAPKRVAPQIVYKSVAPQPVCEYEPVVVVPIITIVSEQEYCDCVTCGC
jgi:hypothetical protein